MADEEELYFANLDEFVNDEDKIVTYKWLSRTLSVPVNKAKQMLYAFVQKHKASKSASHLNITYIIGGRSSVGGENVHRYVITQDENLEETKKTFSPVTSLHIYSIQKCKLKDSNSLYTVDYDIQQQHNNDNNRWSHIHCAAATPLADKGVNRGAHRINGLANGEKCPTTKMVNGSGEPETSHKGSSNLATEQKVKMSGSKAKKGQMSALEMFAAKPSSSKTDKKQQENSEKQQDTKDAKGDESKAGQAKTNSNKAGSMKSFFGKTTTVKKAPEKPATTENDKEAISKKTETVLKKQNQNVENVNKKKRELSSGDEEEDPLPSKISKAIKSDSTEKKVVKGDKKQVQKTEEKQTEAPKSSKVGRKKAVINESDEEPEEKPKKKRKRMKELPKEDSSDDEQIVTNAESEKKLPSDQGSSRSESPLPQQQPRQTENDTARRRKRKRQLKSKTYMDNEGFMVTEKVWESESTDASDEELQITNPPVTEKKPSPAKKIIKKTHADMKNKSAKQASLTSFFKKS